MSKDERTKIEKSFQRLCVAQRKHDKNLEVKARTDLDNAVFDALKLTIVERRQVYEGLETLRRMRLQRKEVEVLVETAENWKPRKKAKRRKKIVEEKPSKRLDTWMER